jgi:hypothetical protein
MDAGVKPCDALGDKPVQYVDRYGVQGAAVVHRPLILVVGVDRQLVGVDQRLDVPLLNRQPGPLTQPLRGKLPGLYGGNPGEASGGNHGQAWSPRFMFRNDSKGEVYVYTPAGDGYGKDIGLGSWNFSPDGNTHSIQQSVNRSTGLITVWYDGKQVLSSKSAPGISGIPFKGVFFSTFFGGHETSWGPKKEVHAYFSNFKVSTTKLSVEAPLVRCSAPRPAWPAPGPGRRRGTAPGPGPVR